MIAPAPAPAAPGERRLPSRFYFDTAYLTGVGVARPRDILFIVLHHSGGAEASDVPWLTTQGQVSVHKYVSRAGTRYHLLDDRQAAWACAVDPRYEVTPRPMGDRWARNENWPALQIEMENPGDRPFTDAQYEAVADWAAGWVQTYGIPADRQHILGHRELTRHPQHQDPNSHWDWDRLLAGLGRRLATAGYRDYPIEAAPSISAARFAATLAAIPGSPLAEDADLYYALCRQYGVDPAVALAFVIKESRAGTAGVAVQTRSWGNQRRARDATRTTGTRQTPWGPFAVYHSWRDSLGDWCETLLGAGYKGEGRTTVRSVLPKYAPASENDTALYTRQVVDWIACWQQIP